MERARPRARRSAANSSEALSGGLGRGGRARQSKISESEALSRGLGRDRVVGPLILRLQEPVLTPHVAMSLVQELGSIVVGNPCSVPSQMAGG